MATHDYVIDNSTGANVRADINLVLQAILTNNSSSSAPSTTAAYMWWADTTNGVLKIRNSSNNDWVELLQLDGTLTLEDGSASTPGLAFRDDLDTGIFSSAVNTFNVATAGVERMELGATTIFNEDGADVDFRIEGDTFANLFYVDAGNDRIGINTNSPSQLLHLAHASGSTILELQRTDTNTTGGTGVINFTASDGHSIGSIGMIGDGDNEGGDIFFRTTTAAANNDPFNAATPTVMTIDSSGNVGIGIEPATGLSIGKQGTVLSGTGNNFGFYANVISNGYVYLDALTGSSNNTSLSLRTYNNGTYTQVIQSISGNQTTFETAGDERMRLDSSGRLLIGTATTDDYDGFNSSLQVSGTSGDASSITISRFSADNSNPTLVLAKSRNGTVAGNTVLQANDICGAIQFQGNDGGGFHQSASIMSKIESGIGSDDVPGNLIFSTNGGSTGVTEHMRLGSNGVLGIGTASPRDQTGIHISKSGGETKIELQRNETNTTGNVGIINFTASDGHSVANMGAFGDGDNEGADLVFKVTSAATDNSPYGTNTDERLRIFSGGKLRATGVYSGTTTGGSPVYVESDGDLLRFTSSSKYKTDIETLEDTRADNILNCRPVWYKSVCANDIKTEGATKSEWGWYGFIAEEVAKIDPRLVSWATKDAVASEEGLKSVERDPSKYSEEGVRYDNFVPLLVNLLKRQKSQIEVLETKVAALEAA
jgi:hypothetical protein